MDILKAANDWVRSELFSTPFVILFGVVFLMTSLGFWQMGRTEMARAYILPTLLAGVLMVAIGLGLFFTNKGRSTQFTIDYNRDASSFIAAEVDRAESTIREYNTIVFTAIPIIIIICAIVLLLVDRPIWRASMIITMVLMLLILLIDSTAHARIDTYHQQLLQAQKDIGK